MGAVTELATPPPVHAPFTDPRYRSLVDAFRALFGRRKDGGGALAVYQHGVPLVDVWAGYADVSTGAPWTADTMAMSFSTSKGVASTMVHRLVQRGVLDVDEPVVTWWPEFGANGKADITLSDVLTHRAGLHRVRGVAETPGDLLDHRRMADRLAARAPERTLGVPAYHAMTFGYLIAAIVERATGSTFAEVLAEEVTGPLGIEGMFISTPAEHHEKIAPFFQSLAPLGLDIARAGHYIKRVPRMRPFVDALLPHGFEQFLNTPAMYAAVVPAANGVFTARGLAKMYGALANKGVVEGEEFLDPGVLAEAGKVRSRERDRVLGFTMRWRLGYHQAFVRSGQQPVKGFGHFGLGGSGAWADPDTGLALAFVTNRLGAATTPIADVRLARLGAVALQCARA